MTAHPPTGGVAAGVALDDAGRPLDQIVLAGISATGYHGVYEHERREGQSFRADVVLHLDTRRAAAGDDLARTVDYGVLAEKVAGVLSGEAVDLIETVAERIAATALADPAVVAVDVAVHKPQAPVTVPFEDVVVRIRRDRHKLPAAEPWTPPAAAVRAGGVLEPTPPAGGPPAPAHAVPVPYETAADDAPQPARPSGDRFDEAPAEPVEAVLAIGSNLGASQSTLRAAVEDIARIEGVQVVTVSPLARTAAVGGPDQPDFLNAVVVVRTTLSPRGLLRAGQAVEAAHGRERTEHWGPRTLDVDLVTYANVLGVSEDLELPHPRAHERAFVLQPWAQAVPDAVLPGLGGGPVAALAATAPDRDGVRWLALDWLTARQPAATPTEPGAAGAPAGEHGAEGVDPGADAGDVAAAEDPHAGEAGAPDPLDPLPGPAPHGPAGSPTGRPGEGRGRVATPVVPPDADVPQAGDRGA